MMRLMLLLSVITMSLSLMGCNNPQTSEPYSISKCDGIAEIGQPAPNFIWMDADNKERSLNEFKGKPIIIVTWDIACTICTKEILPYINDNYDQYSRQGIIMLSVNNGDTSKSLKEFVAEKRYVFPVLTDKDPTLTFRSHYDLKPGNPFLILINKDGNITNKENPGTMEKTDLLIKKMIGDK